jgi:hypothetical protein
VGAQAGALPGRLALPADDAGEDGRDDEPQDEGEVGAERLV